MDAIEGRPVVLEALSGSHNYNLNTPSSDRDYKVFVAPTFADLYKGNMIHKEWIGTERDVLVHDVRKIPELLWKSNPSFLEIMFSREVVIPDTFAAPYIERIYGMRDEIARMNLPYLYDGIMGIARGKFGNMLKGTSGTADLVARFGYDTKQAMHCVRSMEVLERFAENGFSDFGEAIWFDGDGRERMLSIKNGTYALEEFRAYAQERFGRAEELRDAYKAFEPDTETKEELDLMVMDLVRDGISEEFGRVGCCTDARHRSALNPPSVGKLVAEDEESGPIRMRLSGCVVGRTALYIRGTMMDANWSDRPVRRSVNSFHLSNSTKSRIASRARVIHCTGALWPSLIPEMLIAFCEGPKSVRSL